MRFLGIDYGEKRIGLALSDESGRFASPYKVIENKNVLNQLKEVCVKEGVELIVLGRSLNFKKEANPIMGKIEELKILLEKETSLRVEYEDEYFTSAEAERTIGKDEMLDARAAAIILRNYIDRQGNSQV